MSKISECLRALYAANPYGHIGCGTVAVMAADEIERLEAEVVEKATAHSRALNGMMSARADRAELQVEIIRLQNEVAQLVAKVWGTPAPSVREQS